MRAEEGVFMVRLVIKLRGAICEARKTTVVSVLAKINVTTENRPAKVSLAPVGGSA